MIRRPHSPRRPSAAPARTRASRLSPVLALALVSLTGMAAAQTTGIESAPLAPPGSGPAESAPASTDDTTENTTGTQAGPEPGARLVRLPPRRGDGSVRLLPESGGGRSAIAPPGAEGQTTLLPETGGARSAIVPPGAEGQGTLLPGAQVPRAPTPLPPERGGIAPGSGPTELETLPPPGEDADALALPGLPADPGPEEPLPTEDDPAAGSGDDTEELATLPSLRTLTRRDPDAEDDEGEQDRFKAAPFRLPRFPEENFPIRLGAVESGLGARLRVLDMIAGSTETVEIAAGTDGLVGRLRLRVLDCKTPADGTGLGDVGLLQIWDSKTAADAPAFSGWMFAESPALSALDHARYDVWLISCITRSTQASAGNAEKSAATGSASSSSAR